MKSPTSVGYRLLQQRTPRLYLALVQRRGADLNRVTPDCDVVIAGYPGSANSFARTALLHANPELHIASHGHVWSEVADAARLGLPTLLVVREPTGAAASRMVRFRNVSVHDALLDYARFHERVREWRERVVIADFNEVTTGYGAVIDRLNRRFDTEFVRFRDDDEATVNHIRGLLAAANGAIPSAARAEAVKSARSAVEADGSQRLRHRCVVAYRSLVDSRV